MTIICCKVCKTPRYRQVEGVDETEALIDDTHTPLLARDEKYLLASSVTSNNEINTTKKTLLGMVVVAIGTALFCSVGAIVQNHGGSVLQLMLGRYVTQNVIAWIVWFTNPCKLRNNSTCNHWYGEKKYRVNIWVRGFLTFCTTFFWWRGLELVPLGDGEAILFLSPITTIIAARFLLGEKLPKTFFFTLLMTVSGLIFICQPTIIFGSDNEVVLSWKGILFLIGTVIAWTACCVLVRTAKSAHWLQLEIVASAQSVFLWCPAIIVINRLLVHSDGLSGGDWDYSLNTFIVMIIIGFLGFCALMFNVIGYQIGEATKVAYMEYLDLVFAFLYQWLYFEDIPTYWEIIGCCMLLSTCMIHMGEEYYRYMTAKTCVAAASTNEGIMSNSANEMQPLLSKSTAETALASVQYLQFINGMNIFKNSDSADTDTDSYTE